MRDGRLKILFIGPNPPPYSGPELGMQKFLQSEILNEHYQIFFLKTNFRKQNENKGRFGVRMISNFFLYFFRLTWKLVSTRAKCIYYPVTPTQIGWLGRDAWTILLARAFGRKVIIHLRGSHFRLNFRTFTPQVKKIVEQALTKTDCALVQADYLRDQFSPYLLPEKINVLYQAIDISECINTDINRYIKGKILIVGHLTKAKGYIDILRIIPDIVDVFPYVHFWFAGEIRRGERGVFYNQYNGEKLVYEDPFDAEQKILSSKYAAHYHNLGIISGDEKLNHFKSCDIFLSASYSEGFSRSLLEAMAFGKPLVYTPVGAHREVLTDGINGVKFEPGSLRQLKSAIEKLLLSRDFRNQIALKNYHEARDKYSQERIDLEFLTIINKVVSS